MFERHQPPEESMEADGTEGVPRAVREALAASYALERELGRGGMATVYLARDLRHRRQVAIKVLHPELSAVLGPRALPARDRAHGVAAAPAHPAPCSTRARPAGCSTT
jgi:hypothetical protein